MMLNKDIAARMCAAARMQPVKKLNFRNREIFIADGFSSIPHITFKRFGVDPLDFPNGAFCTIWFVAKNENFFEVGAPLLFDKFHDPVISHGNKQRARVNKALSEAQTFMLRREKVHLHG